MVRASNYNLYYKLDNLQNEYLLFHGYSGAVDVVTEEVYQALADAEKVGQLSGEVVQTLLKRGYLTPKSAQEELATFQKVAEAVGKAKRKSFELTFIPTYNCNFRCEYCFEKKVMENSKEWMSRIMDEATVDAVMAHVDKQREDGYFVQNVSLFGGEPLLKSNHAIVKYILDRCLEKKLAIQAITNGYDLDRMLDLLGKGKISSIQITLDGTESVHDSRRYLAGGQPTFAKIVANIDLCLKNEVRLVVRSNISASNLEKVEELMAFYREKGWLDNPLFDYYFKSTHKCYEANKDNIITDPELMERITKIVGAEKRFSLNSIYSSLVNKLSPIFEKKAIAPFTATHCGAVNGMIVVDPYGDIYPCWDVIGRPEEKIGTIDYEQSAINFNAKNDLWLNRTVGRIEACAACPYGLFCAGGCAAHAQHTNKDAYTSYCDSFQQIFDEILPALYKQYAAKEPESLEKVG